jgi:hypothetical protein
MLVFAQICHCFEIGLSSQLVFLSRVEQDGIGFYLCPLSMDFKSVQINDCRRGMISQLKSIMVGMMAAAPDRKYLLFTL